MLAMVVALYAEALRGSPWVGNASLSHLAFHADRLSHLLAGDPEVMEFAELVSAANRLQR